MPIKSVKKYVIAKKGGIYFDDQGDKNPIFRVNIDDLASHDSKVDHGFTPTGEARFMPFTPLTRHGLFHT